MPYTVYNNYAYSTATEIIRQETDLLNAASQGCLTFMPGAMRGDFGFEAFWASIPGLVKSRDVNGVGDQVAKDLSMLENVMVKCGMGTVPVNLQPAYMEWLQRNPEEAGAALGKQVAKQSMVHMINTGIGAMLAATLNQGASVTADCSADTVATMTNSKFVRGAGLLGDAANEIKLWVMHSYGRDCLLLNNLSNSEKLFTYDNVNIVRDVSGRVILISDIPSLYIPNAVPANVVNYALGLTPEAIKWTDNADFLGNMQVSNGKENIQRTYQSEWSWNLALKGYKWNKAISSPSTAAITTGTNWTKVPSSIKDLGAVAVKSK